MREMWVIEREGWNLTCGRASSVWAGLGRVWERECGGRRRGSPAGSWLRRSGPASRRRSRLIVRLRRSSLTLSTLRLSMS